jgi:hypothetical protein
MEHLDFLDRFPGIATPVASEPKIMFGRIFLMLLGISAVNASVMFLDGGKAGTLFVGVAMRESGLDSFTKLLGDSFSISIRHVVASPLRTSVLSAASRLVSYRSGNGMRPFFTVPPFSWG